jgi:protoheme IX farnesyltransferase
MMIIKAYLTLCRIYISLFAACSAATGFFLAPYHRLADVLLPAGAVLLLSCGASALNQYQERNFDAKMERTRRRPLPCGSVSPMQALFFSIGLIIAGLFMLIQAGEVIAFALGLFALFWYNAVYTCLKKRMAFASVPGAAVGMIPPAIGWLYAGGELFDPRLAATCFIFFMWQIPHFWLLLLRSGDDYSRAGFPSLLDIMGPVQLARVTFTWIAAASVATLLLPLYGAIKSPFVYSLFIPPAIWLVWHGSLLIKNQPPLLLSPELFRKINIYLLLIMSLLSLENIFYHVP